MRGNVLSTKVKSIMHYERQMQKLKCNDTEYWRRTARVSICIQKKNETKERGKRLTNGLKQNTQTGDTVNTIKQKINSRINILW